MFRIALLTLFAAGTARAADAPRPTFTQDVAAILFDHCTTCHRPNQVGPFPLLTYADARKRAGQIAEVTASKFMPPWKPDKGHGTFRDDRSLNATAIATLQKWAAAGAPEGPAAALPKAPTFRDGWQLGTPDLILTMPVDYRVPAEGPDVYVNFVFPTGLTRERYIKAVEVLPGNRRVVHHVVGMLDDSGTARKLAAKGGGSYTSFGGAGFVPKGFLPGYAPGTTPRLIDPAYSIPLKQNMDVVYQFHYHPTGKPESDKSQIGIYFAKRPPTKKIVGVLMGSDDVNIPPGDKAYTRTDSYTLPAAVVVQNTFAHMHMIGKKVKVWAKLPDGSTRRMLQISDWDFSWQDTYHYATPLVLPKGTVIHAEFTWDNTADNPRNPNRPPQRITLGENSTDEMAGLWIGGTPVRQDEDWMIWLATIGHYFEIQKKGYKKPK